MAMPLGQELLGEKSTQHPFARCALALSDLVSLDGFANEVNRARRQVKAA